MTISATAINRSNTVSIIDLVSQISIFMLIQIADFGMSRDLIDHNYYITSGGKIPVKWTAPEVMCHLQ